jgi:hypothetical protein
MDATAAAHPTNAVSVLSGRGVEPLQPATGGQEQQQLQPQANGSGPSRSPPPPTCPLVAQVRRIQSTRACAACFEPASPHTYTGAPHQLGLGLRWTHAEVTSSNGLTARSRHCC